MQEYNNWQQNEEQDISLTVLRTEVNIITEGLQRKTNEDRRYIWRKKKRVKWKLLQQRWNVKMMNEFRELEKIHIYLLEKKTLKGMESQQEGSAEIQNIYDGILVLEASQEDGRYCFFKIDDCCMFAGHIVRVPP